MANEDQKNAQAAGGAAAGRNDVRVVFRRRPISTKRFSTIEREWVTAAGLPAVLALTHHGLLCGYVAVSRAHPLWGAADDEVDCDVHGGVTWSRDRLPAKPASADADRPWWFGFDCAHAWDAPSFGGTLKGTDYVVTECERLAEQLAARARAVVE